MGGVEAEQVLRQSGGHMGELRLAAGSGRDLQARGWVSIRVAYLAVLGAEVQYSVPGPGRRGHDPALPGRMPATSAVRDTAMPEALKNRRFLERLRFALSGLRQCWLGERSFRFQAAAAIAVAVVLLLFRPPLVWAALLVLVTALVLSAELLNSALESLADRLQSKPDERIKAAKDMAAAAVLVLACTAVLIALLAIIAVAGAPV
jgi:diacylglycerol kinase (ATP)